MTGQAVFTPAPVSRLLAVRIVKSAYIAAFALTAQLQNRPESAFIAFGFDPASISSGFGIGPASITGSFPRQYDQKPVMMNAAVTRPETDSGFASSAGRTSSCNKLFRCRAGICLNAGKRFVGERRCVRWFPQWALPCAVFRAPIAEAVTPIAARHQNGQFRTPSADRMVIK